MNQLNILDESGYAAGMKQAERELEKRRNEGTLSSFDGCAIHYEYYLAEKPMGCLVVVHGFTEFSRKYDELCWYFLQQGYHVFLHDLRGHGMSGRQVEDTALAHVDCYEDYARDLEQYISRIVQPVAGELPVHIFSHSMGSAIAMLYLMEQERSIGKVILSSPMVVPVTPLPPWYLQRYTAKVAGKQGWNTRFPHASTFNPDPAFQKSSDASESRFRRHIELRRADVRYQNSSATNAWMYHTLQVGKKILNKEKLAGLKTDFLLLQAGKDRVVLLKPQNKLAELLPRCRLERFPDAKHTIFNGKSQTVERYVSLVLGFLEEG